MHFFSPDRPRSLRNLPQLLDVPAILPSITLQPLSATHMRASLGVAINSGFSIAHRSLDLPLTEVADLLTEYLQDPETTLRMRFNWVFEGTRKPPAPRTPSTPPQGPRPAQIIKSPPPSALSSSDFD